MTKPASTIDEDRETGCPKKWTLSKTTQTCVVRVNYTANWEMARKTCSTLGGDLVVIKDQEMNDIIKSSLRQVLPGRRDDSDPQQPGSANRTLGCQDGHLTRTAKVDRSDVNSKGGPKRRQHQSIIEHTLELHYVKT
ncbi:C-type lectin domain family 4 member A [Elysia marginata]|uniref:C-type lectin domain family 4 member A n=1 Tax=Elysia marginata TaxID=1093978 RepID=A0AAV4JFX9_9GAST|nr:C-type lectin domain family 4 member A [Elysia marginata]